jgi:hypothetical protein
MDVFRPGRALEQAVTGNFEQVRAVLRQDNFLILTFY